VHFKTQIRNDIPIESIPTFIGGTFEVDYTKSVVLDLRPDGPLAIPSGSDAEVEKVIAETEEKLSIVPDEISP
jgi:hypothetical protein